MTTNFYFNNFSNSQEQTLIEDLVIESIKIYGQDVIYIKRSGAEVDSILNEDDFPEYTESFTIEMYIKNVDGFEGEGDFLSKFGLEIRDSITFTVANRIWEQDVGYEIEEVRPREGDIIYFPLNGKLFEIRHVEHESIFYQMGALQTYDLRCELFEYSGERFATGYPEIDSIFDNAERKSPTLSYEDFSDNTGYTANADNDQFEIEGEKILDFTETNPFGEDVY
jgi:hypothetical protein